MSSQRARVGGQTGINGEFYKGGTFLPSTERSKALPKQTRKKSRCSLVEPGKLEVAPEGQAAIFQRILNFVNVIDGQAAASFEDAHPSMTYYFTGPQELHSLIAAYNRGERFI